MKFERIFSILEYGQHESINISFKEPTLDLSENRNMRYKINNSVINIIFEEYIQDDSLSPLWDRHYINEIKGFQVVYITDKLIVLRSNALELSLKM